MRRTYLYKGYQSLEAFELFQECWQSDDCIVFCPPDLSDFAFVEKLPLCEISLRGELWENTQIDVHPQQSQYPELPICGVFTSGTTHSSKLVLYSRENLHASINGIYGLFSHLDIDSVFCYPQPFHTFTLTLGFAAAAIRSFKLQFADGKYSRKHHEKWMEQITPRSMTLGTPTHFYDLISWLQDNKLRAPESCAAIIGGAKVKKQLWLDCQDLLKIKNPSIGYGATEASPGVTHLRPGLEPLEDGEIGAPLKHLRVSIQRDGLRFSGPSLCLATIQEGQLQFPKDFVLPDIIEAAKVDRWIYKTRSKWFINRGGEKFSLEKIEQEVFNATEIEILSFPVKHHRLGEELGFLIQTKAVDFTDKRKRVYQSLEHIFGRQFEQKNCMNISKFPYNENLKADRRAALEIFAKQGHQAQPAATPSVTLL